MKILILSQFYWPEVRSAPTNLAALAEHLASSGDQVTVITGFPNHPFGKIYDGYRQSIRQWEDIRGVDVLRVPLYADHSMSTIRRLLHYGSFALSSAAIGGWSTRHLEFDAIFVYLPPWTNWLPIRLLKLMHGAPAVYWVTDIWPEAFEAIGKDLRPWQTAAMHRLVGRVIRQATAICVNSPGLKQLLIDKGMPEQRLEVITDWADEEVFFPSEPDAELAQRHGLAGKFNVLYGGNLGAAQGLETVIEAAALLRGMPDLQFVFIGDGTDDLRLKRLAEHRHADNVRFIDRQPMAEMHRFFAIADVLVMHLVRSPIYRLQVPSKTMAYLACGRPILCGIAGSAATIIEEAGAGLCCEPGDPQAMAEAVRELYAMSADQRAALGQRGRTAYLENYTKAVQAERVRELLQRVASGLPS